MALDLRKLSESDLEARERFHEIIVTFEDALFLTIKAALGNNTRETARGKSKRAWKELADDVIEFALED